jgi:hypothetical protein
MVDFGARGMMRIACKPTRKESNRNNAMWMARPPLMVWDDPVGKLMSPVNEGQLMRIHSPFLDTV